MDLKDIFNKKVPNKDALLQDGFKLNDQHLSKDFLIMDGEYKLTVVISLEGEVSFNVVDANSHEGYDLVHVPDAKGAFVGKVRRACEKVLKDIANRCFDRDVFKSQQTKRTVEFMKNQLGIEPEFLWEKFPDYAVFRVADNQKWFAIIMSVEKSKLNLEGDGNVEVINVKDSPEKVDAYLQSGVFLGAYHMNKKHWFSIPLNDSVEDDDIREKIQVSYNLISHK